MTWSEQHLWKELRKLNANFRRQAPIGRFFADFAVHAQKLVVEVDGSVHERLPDVASRDLERQRWLQAEGYTVVRLTDREVSDDVHECVERVKRELVLLGGRSAAEVEESEALLLDGGGLVGGVAAVVTQARQVGAGAQRSLSPRLPAYTTIPALPPSRRKGNEP